MNWHMVVVDTLLMAASACDEATGADCPTSRPANGDECSGTIACSYGDAVTCCSKTVAAAQSTCSCRSGMCVCVDHSGLCKGMTCEAGVATFDQAGFKAWLNNRLAWNRKAKKSRDRRSGAVSRAYPGEDHEDAQEPQPHPGDKVLLIIDDLDRCTRDEIAKLLRSIRKYLPLDPICLLLAVDKATLMAAVPEYDRGPAGDNRPHRQSPSAVRALEKYIRQMIPLPRFTLSSGQDRVRVLRLAAEMAEPGQQFRRTRWREGRERSTPGWACSLLDFTAGGDRLSEPLDRGYGYGLIYSDLKIKSLDHPCSRARVPT